MSTADLSQRIYRQFGIGPLVPEKQIELYVDLTEVRGKMDVANRLEQGINFSEEKTTCQLLAGHNGSGKSTELYRLKKKLESSEPRFFVVYIKSHDELDRNDVDFPDILIAIIRQLAFQLQKSEGITLKPGYFEDRFNWLKKRLTSPLDFDALELNLGFLKLGGHMRASPDARKEIRKYFEPDASNWLYAANDVIGQSIQQLNAKGYAGLVVLIDDLDKMTVRAHETGCPTDEYLFVNRAAQLTAFNCHMVYTIPLSLAYSHLEPVIRSRYGGQIPVVPMTKIAQKPPKKDPYELGMEKFRQIVIRRLEAAPAQEIQAFEDEHAP